MPEADKPPRRQVILSGMQPTGALHVGNLEGALRNWVELQDDYEFYACVVDWHSLTGIYEDTKALKGLIEQMTIDFLAAGLDPEKCAIFVQSDVKEHAELHLLFSMLVTVPTLLRLPTYHEKKDRLDSYGFLGYPVLQAADICVYDADKVPVGKDQEKHVWLANDLAKRFNHIYGKTFHEPEALLREIPDDPGVGQPEDVEVVRQPHPDRADREADRKADQAVLYRFAEASQGRPRPAGAMPGVSCCTEFTRRTPNRRSRRRVKRESSGVSTARSG